MPWKELKTKVCRGGKDARVVVQSPSLLQRAVADNFFRSALQSETDCRTYIARCMWFAVLATACVTFAGTDDAVFPDLAAFMYCEDEALHWEVSAVLSKILFDMNIRPPAVQ